MVLGTIIPHENSFSPLLSAGRFLSSWFLSSRFLSVSLLSVSLGLYKLKSGAKVP
ncbi:hypothetical protein CIPAW_14G030500 [Carya illinoinensis]|uniref:Uncharacterized protein n=1 Tax=Carya illinoinensis TaxID=32201 RepID=A0A8T1NHV7_CARIL|nr:hypothetical protein CIPAW_14G030500 [Carya illinoinensis]